MSLPITEIARALAAEAHAGQTRKHGAPYIDHPIAVAAIAVDLAHAVGVHFDDDAIATALLHDVIEDSPAHDEGVVAARLSPEIATRVVHLTKTGKGEAATAAYYERLMGALPTTRLTKIADRLHNLSELHKAHRPEAGAAKLAEYIIETERFVRPLCGGFADDVRRGLHAALDDALDNARRNGAVCEGMATSAAARSHGLYAIVQPRGGEAAMLARLDAILRGGAARVQLRVKPADGLDDGAWLELLCTVAMRCAPYGASVVVNDRADLAFGAGLRGHVVGVHVGDRDLPPAVARALLGTDALVGTSTHSLAQLRATADAGSACHLALGPIWASPTKQGHAAVVGDDVLAAACAVVTHPVVAIGGITNPSRAADVADAGAAFAAVVSAVDDDDLEGVHLMTRRLCLSFAAARAARTA
jgi:thiamine-phosphate pyrophosphorylase